MMKSKAKKIDFTNSRAIAEYSQSTCGNLLNHGKVKLNMAHDARVFALSIQGAIAEKMAMPDILGVVSDLLNAFDLTYFMVESAEWPTFRKDLLDASKDCGFTLDAYAQKACKKVPHPSYGDRYKPTNIKITQYVKAADVVTTDSDDKSGHVGHVGTLKSETQDNPGNNPDRDQHIGEPANIASRLDNIIQLADSSYEKTLVTLLGMREEKNVSPIMLSQGYTLMTDRVKAAMSADVIAANKAEKQAAAKRKRDNASNSNSNS